MEKATAKKERPPRQPNLLTILTYPDKKLKEVADPVPKEEITTDAFEDFLQDMVHTMIQRRGIGLAATQVGTNKRVLVFVTKRNTLGVLINPKIIAKSGTYRVRGRRLFISSWHSSRC